MRASRTDQGFIEAKASHEIQSAISQLLYSEHRAEMVCKTIKRDLGYDLVAIQLTELLQQIVQTVSGLGPEDKWYKLASHPLDVPEDFRDIQAHIAVSHPPVIEIVAGWHWRFDPFIYKEYGHEHYVRAFVPLILERDENGRLTVARAEDFDFKISGTGNRVIRLTPRSASRTYEIIGTVEAGFDNKRRPKPADISNEAAATLFKTACEHAIGLFPYTLWNVLQDIVNYARWITGAASAAIEFPVDADFPYRVWSGVAPDEYERMPDVAKLRLPIYSKPRFDRRAEENPIPPTTGALFLGFPARSAVDVSEQKDLDAFIGHHVVDAVEHATNLVRSLHQARQLENLHDIASALSIKPEHLGLLATVAGHAQNILAADVVAIYQFQTGGLQKEVEIVGVRFAPLPFKWTPPPDLIQDLQQGVRIKSANTPDKLAQLYGVGSDGAAQFVELEQIKTAAIAALRVSDEVVGVMLINFRRNRNFSDADKKSIETVASTAAIAIRTKQLLTQREEDVGQLVHDLSAMLDVMVTKAKILKRNVDSLKTNADLVAGQSDVLQSISKTVQMTLGEHPSAGVEEHEVLDIRDILDRLWNVVKQRHGRRRVNLRYDQSFESGPTVCWSRSALFYVAYALLDNAGKYADKESTVCVGCSQNEGQFRIAVTSTGLPIGVHERERIFGKFTRGEATREAENRKGVGLGLFIARSVMQLNNASLDLETDKRISRFIITIPQVSGSGGHSCGYTEHTDC